MFAVITGATRGIGKAIAERFAVAGFSLVLGARNQADLNILKSELESRYKIKVIIKAANFQKKADVVLFAEHVRQNTPAVDVLVNNVGAYLNGTIFDEPGDRLLEQLQLNLLSAHYLTSALADGFKARRRGHIFTIGSVLSTNLRDEAAFYTISKHALYTWHKLLFNEMRKHNVKSTIVLPSSTNTSSWKDMPVPFDELIQPETVAESVYQCYNLGGDAIVDEISIKTMKRKYD